VNDKAPGRATQSLAEAAYRELERQLVTLALKPGQLLQEKELATALAIGRTPVREAVQRLASQGLLRVLPRKGLLVAPLSAPQLGRVIETRRVLERLLVVKAAERADARQRERLATLGQRIGGADLETFFDLDRALDDCLAEAADNPFLAASLQPLHSHCRRLWFLNRDSLDLGQAVGLHASLAAAVSAGDNAGAIGALNGIIGILEYLGKQLEFAA